MIGTDAVREMARGTADRARGATGNAVDRARSTTGKVTDRARNLPGNVPAFGNGVSGSGNADGSGSGSASLLGSNAAGAGNLALAGTGAANAGAFPVSPGMVVTNAKGRVIGTVQSVRSTARGTVQKVLVRVGNKVAELPAVNFTGSGNVLVSAMGKGDTKDAAQ